MKPKNYQVTEIELYLSEVGDGDPDLQFTPQEEYVIHTKGVQVDGQHIMKMT